MLDIVFRNMMEWFEYYGAYKKLKAIINIFLLLIIQYGKHTLYMFPLWL